MPVLFLASSCRTPLRRGDTFLPWSCLIHSGLNVLWLWLLVLLIQGSKVEEGTYSRSQLEWLVETDPPPLIFCPFPGRRVQWINLCPGDA